MKHTGKVYNVSGNTISPFANGELELTTAESPLSIKTDSSGNFELEADQSWTNGETDKIVAVTSVTTD